MMHEEGLLFSAIRIVLIAAIVGFVVNYILSHPEFIIKLRGNYDL